MMSPHQLPDLVADLIVLSTMESWTRQRRATARFFFVIHNAIICSLFTRLFRYDNGKE
jgi:hypothetical protein